MPNGNTNLGWVNTEFSIGIFGFNKVKTTLYSLLKQEV